MARFMIGGDLLLLIRNHPAPFLLSHSDLDKGLLDILLDQIGTFFLGRQDRRLMRRFSSSAL